MDDAAPRVATYQDVLAAPEHQVAEVLAGVRCLSPCRTGPQAAAASGLGEELGPPFKRAKGGPGGWLILDQPQVDAIELEMAVLWAGVQL